MSGTIFRRFLVLGTLIFWQGGFMFYGAVVVPLARAVVNPPSDFAFVTQIATLIQNVVGLVTVGVLWWDLRASTDTDEKRARRRWQLWAFLVLGVVLLFLVRLPMDQRMDRATKSIVTEGLIPWHVTYLWIATMQWAAAVWYAIVLLKAWQSEDSSGKED